jgi:hypothetical protein
LSASETASYSLLKFVSVLPRSEIARMLPEDAVRVRESPMRHFYLLLRQRARHKTYQETKSSRCMETV